MKVVNCWLDLLLQGTGIVLLGQTLQVFLGLRPDGRKGLLESTPFLSRTTGAALVMFGDLDPFVFAKVPLMSFGTRAQLSVPASLSTVVAYKARKESIFLVLAFLALAFALVPLPAPAGSFKYLLTVPRSMSRRAIWAFFSPWS